jgi:hypothetical protein
MIKADNQFAYKSFDISEVMKKKYRNYPPHYEIGENLLSSNY